MFQNCADGVWKETIFGGKFPLKMTFNVFRIGRLSPSDADPVAGVEMRSAAVSVASSP